MSIEKPTSSSSSAFHHFDSSSQITLHETDLELGHHHHHHLHHGHDQLHQDEVKSFYCLFFLLLLISYLSPFSSALNKFALAVCFLCLMLPLCNEMNMPLLIIPRYLRSTFMSLTLGMMSITIRTTTTLSAMMTVTHTSLRKHEALREIGSFASSGVWTLLTTLLHRLRSLSCGTQPTPRHQVM